MVRRKWWSILIFTTGTAIAVAIGYLLPPVYRSSTLILVERQKVPENYVKPTVTSTIEDRLKTISQQIMSRNNLEKIVEEFHLYRQERGTLSQEELFDRMRKNIEVKVMGKDAFTVAYSGSDPKTVMGVTNTLASLFIEENLKAREQQAEGTSEFLLSELGEAKRELEKQEKDLKEFKEKYMGALPQQMEANLRTLDRLQLEFQATNDALRNMEDRRISYEKEAAAGGGETGPEPLETKLARLKADLSRLQAEYTDNYPDIVVLKKEIRETETQLKEGAASSESSRQSPGVQSQKVEAQLQAIHSEIGALREKQKRINGLIKEYERRVEASPTNEEKLSSLTRDYEISQKNYEALLGKKLDAKISENLEKRQKGEQFRILDPANLPEKPYKPDRFKIILLGILASGGASFGLTFLVELLYPSFKKPEDLSGVVDLPVLTIIPTMPKNNGGHLEGKTHEKLISVREPSSVLTDQYRILYSRLHQINKKQSHKVFAISSAVQDEGKTMTTLNLAVVMARDFGKKTLLIEGDCKHPSIPIYLKTQFSKGLGDALWDMNDARSAMVNFVHENLSILPASGVIQNSAGLLSSPEMIGLIQSFREQYDYVLIDSPPVLPLSDMNMIAEIVDGIILVIRAEKTLQGAVQQAVESLATDKLIGIVLNDVRPPFLRKYRYDYYYKKA